MNDINEIIARLDAFFSREDLAGAKELLYTSLAQARAAGDKKLCASLYNEIMGFERQYGSLKAAVSAAQAALSLLEETGLSVSFPAAMMPLNAATVCKRAGDNETAAKLYMRAEELFNRFYPAGAAEFAGLYNNMASLYLDTGDYPKAEYYYDRAMGILNRTGKTSDLAVTWFNKALLYNRSDPFSGKTERCVDVGLRVLDIPEGERDGYYYYSCRKCAGAAAELGFFAAERELTERADAFYERH